jgi:hypothetical protein
MLKLFIIVILVFIAPFSVRAANGCVKNEDGSKIYTSLNSGTDYNKNGTTVNLTGGCSWNFISPSTPCTVSSPAKPGFLAIISPQLCPIDDYIWIMITLIGGFGYLFIRRRNMQLVSA